MSYSYDSERTQRYKLRNQKKRDEELGITRCATGLFCMPAPLPNPNFIRDLRAMDRANRGDPESGSQSRDNSPTDSQSPARPSSPDDDVVILYSTIPPPTTQAPVVGIQNTQPDQPQIALADATINSNTDRRSGGGPMRFKRDTHRPQCDTNVHAPNIAEPPNVVARTNGNESGQFPLMVNAPLSVSSADSQGAASSSESVPARVWKSFRMSTGGKARPPRRANKVSVLPPSSHAPSRDNAEDELEADYEDDHKEAEVVNEAVGVENDNISDDGTIKIECAEPENVVARAHGDADAQFGPSDTQAAASSSGTSEPVRARVFRSFRMSTGGKPRPPVKRVNGSAVAHANPLSDVQAVVVPIPASSSTTPADPLKSKDDVSQKEEN